MTTPTGPLTGIRVIDITTVVLGPYCSQTLGDMGADVIKVETTEGDSTRLLGPSRTPGMGSYFANLNRNKRSIALDLKKPAAHEAILRLVETADIFVHNMRIGAANRLGLDYATLSARNPKLIYACASGFRKGSSMQEFPAYDDLIQGVSGIASLNAGPDGAPRYFPTVVVDKLTGAMLASMIGMALFHRERTGEGQEIHLPMMETILSFTLVEHLSYGTLGEPEKGLRLPADADAASPALSDQGRLHQRNRSQRRPVEQVVRGDGCSAPDQRSPVQLCSVSRRQYRRGLRDADRGHEAAQHGRMAGGATAGGYSLRQGQWSG